MPRLDAPTDLKRRLPWLLVFRAAVATALLLLTLTADLAGWPLRRISPLLYGVVIGTYVVVLLVAGLLRQGTNPVFLSVVHIATVVLGAALVVQGTGGVESTFSFLYVLAILDAAIIGNMPVAMACAGCCCAIYGTQLFVQWDQVLPYFAFQPPELEVFSNAAVTHTAAFFLSGWLAGHLAEQSQRARRELFAAEHLYAVVLESLPVGVLTLDKARQVRLANAAAGKILGVEHIDLVGNPLPAVLEKLLSETLPSGLAVVQLNGQARSLALSRSPLGSIDGRHGADEPCDVLVLDDRTALRALEETLRAREKLASIGQLSAAMAHELRNPLAAISGCVELFRGEEAPAQRERLASIVLREIERLNVLINDFLSYARPSPPQRLPVDLGALTHDVCDFMRKDANFCANVLSVDAAEGITINADAGQLRQLLWNLLKNALEASQPGAAVEVVITRDAPDSVTLTVCDHGAGITDAVRERMFEPFHTTKEHGTGLGLAVVHSIVKAHAGSIDVTSSLTQGTQMRIHLPG